MTTSRESLPSRTVTRNDIVEFWHECTGIRREDIFGPEDALRPNYRCCSLQWQVDVAAVGYVGIDYEPGGVAMLSVNPAGGGDDLEPNPASDKMYECLVAFRDSKLNGELLESAFYDSHEAFRRSFPNWTITRRHYNKILTKLGKRFDEIAFLYVVPFRTRGDKGSTMPERFLTNGYEKHLRRQMVLLSPGTVVAMDRPSEAAAKRYRRAQAPETRVCYWTRQHNVPDAERLAALQECIDAAGAK